jgi:hypothetical protein
MADPQNPIVTTNLAYRGQAINLDNYPAATFPVPSSVSIVSAFENYEPDPTIDFTDLHNVTNEIIHLRIRLHKIRIELKAAKRKALIHKVTYEQEKKRTWIGITGGSDKSREAAAEIMTEQLMTNFLVASAVAEELNQHSRDIRTELDALKEISNNLRRQIDMR